MGGLPNVADLVDTLKTQGLGNALASLQTRAGLANAWQDIGMEVIELLTAILAAIGPKDLNTRQTQNAQTIEHHNMANPAVAKYMHEHAKSLR